MLRRVLIILLIIVSAFLSIMVFLKNSDSVRNEIDDESISLWVMLSSDKNHSSPESRVVIYLDEKILASAHLKLQPVDVINGGDVASRRIMGNIPLVLKVNGCLLKNYKNLKIVDEEWGACATVSTKTIVRNDASIVIFNRDLKNGNVQWGVGARATGGKYKILDGK